MFRTFIIQFVVLSFLLNFSILQHITPSVDYWDYQRYGPDLWPHRFDICEGESQSPIDIRTSHVIYDPHLAPLSLNGYTTNTSSYIWNFTHNGYTIIAYPPPLARLSISGVNLLEKFHLVEFHFHWGYNAYQGSEHTINGIKYPLEIQFVHQAHFSDVLAIVSILFDLRRDDNLRINELLSIVNQTTNSSISIEHRFDLSRLFSTDPSPRFYHYNGSLTTPPCTESVIWIVLARKIPISPYQLEVFAANSLPFNFRHPQKLHSRKVFANFQPQIFEDLLDEETTDHSLACMKQTSISLSVLIFIIFLVE